MEESAMLETVFPIAVLAGKTSLSASSIHFSSSSGFLEKRGRIYQTVEEGGGILDADGSANLWE